jgi:hypothetical protein
MFNDKITNPKMDKRIALNPDDHTYHKCEPYRTIHITFFGK